MKQSIPRITARKGRFMNFWTIPFSEHGKEYQIRVTFDGMTFRLRVFLDGRPANGFEYSVALETAMDIRDITGNDAVTELIQVAKDHIRRNL